MTHRHYLDCHVRETCSCLLGSTIDILDYLINYLTRVNLSVVYFVVKLRFVLLSQVLRSEPPALCRHYHGYLYYLHDVSEDTVYISVILSIYTPGLTPQSCICTTVLSKTI